MKCFTQIFSSIDISHHTPIKDNILNEQKNSSLDEDNNILFEEDYNFIHTDKSFSNETLTINNKEEREQSKTVSNTTDITSDVVENYSSVNSCNENTKCSELAQENSLSDSVKLKFFLRNWAIKNRIINTALSELLCELKSHQCFNSLCIDARTLLQTPLQYELKNIEQGKYIHFGLRYCIQNIIQGHNLTSTCIEIVINIDGLHSVNPQIVHFGQF